MSNSCSFRITRTAEDLAQTLNVLSQRLIDFEKRLDALESKVSSNDDIHLASSEIEMLDGVDRLLKDCHEMLDVSTPSFVRKDQWENENDSSCEIAA